MSQQRQPMYNDSGGGGGDYGDTSLRQSNFFLNRDGILNDDAELINDAELIGDDNMFEYDDAKNDETFGDIEGM